MFQILKFKFLLFKHLIFMHLTERDKNIENIYELWFHCRT